MSIPAFTPDTYYDDALESLRLKVNEHSVYTFPEGTDGQELRWRDGAPAYVKSKEAFLNDRTDIDKTGTDDMASTIQTYLNEYAAAGIYTVYSDTDSIYKLASAISIPTFLRWEGGYLGQRATLKWYGTPSALDNTSHMVAMPNNRSQLVGLNFDLRGVQNSVALRPTGHVPLIEYCSFYNTHESSVSIRGGGALYMRVRLCSFTGVNSGAHIDMRSQYQNDGAGAYYGFNVGEISQCAFGGSIKKPYLQNEGIFTVRECAFEATCNGAEAVVVAGDDVQSAMIMIGCYFELTDATAGVTPLVAIKCIAKTTLLHNRVYGAQQSLAGSCAVKGVSTAMLVSMGNEYGRWEKGISIAMTDTTVGEPAHLGPDTADQCTTPYDVSGPYIEFSHARRYRTNALGVAAQPVPATKTSAYTLTMRDYFVPVSGASGAVDITLPAANAVNNGKEFIVKATNIANTVRLVPSGSDTIDGGGAHTFAGANETIRVIGDGSSKWLVL